MLVSIISELLILLRGVNRKDPNGGALPTAMGVHVSRVIYNTLYPLLTIFLPPLSGTA